MRKYKKSELDGNGSFKTGELILEKILVDLNYDDKTNDEYLGLIRELLEAKLIKADDLKNFLNQTLLQFACLNHDVTLCELLLKHGADCTVEDNYRLTALIISAKCDHLSNLKLLTNSIKKKINDEQLENCLDIWYQVRRAAYSACCAGYLNSLKFLFEQFNLHSEQLIDESFQFGLQFGQSERLKFDEPNALHVASYKGYIEIVEYLVLKCRFVKKFINSKMNSFRDCTPLEEAFKGFLILDTDHFVNQRHSSFKIVLLRKENELKNEKFKQILIFLIENGAKFSPSFISNNGLSKLVIHIFSGPRKDSDFVHFLYCCCFLFKFKLNEIYLNSNDISLEEIKSLNQDKNIISIGPVNDCSKYIDIDQQSNKSCKISISKVHREHQVMQRNLEDFLLKIYAFSLKVIKDYKQICMNLFVEMVLSLYNSGQLRIQKGSLSFLREKHFETYEIIEKSIQGPMSLKTLSLIQVKKSIKNFGPSKIDGLSIPKVLKNDLFQNGFYNRKFIYLNQVHSFFI